MKTLTEEHKKKISLGIRRAIQEGKLIGHPGRIAWNKGMSKKNGDFLIYGKPRSNETRLKMSKAATGREKSEDHKMKISLGLNGKKQSPEVRKKISEKMRLRWSDSEYRKRVMPSYFGHPPWNKGKPECFDATAVAKMLTHRGRTSLETKFQGIIDKNNLPYKFVGDGSFMIGRKNPDFININGEKIAIEVYARYYKLRHAETIKEWKEERERVFREYGWEAIFFDETQVNESNVLNQLRR